MTQPRRSIRKVTNPGQLVVDEQFWPVILALFVLAGFLMGTVAAYLPFGAKHWWLDARTWLFAIPLAACVLVWLLRYVPSRVVRRALQVSLVLCFLLHLGLLVLSLESRIFSSILKKMERPTARRPQRELRIVNDYQPHQLEQVERRQQEFMKPVETSTPETEQVPVEKQQETPTEQVTETPPPMPAPERPREAPLNAIEKPQPAETRPRQSESLSKLSRQTAEVKPTRSEPVRAPATAAASAATSSLDARSDSLRQRTPQPTNANTSTQAPPTMAANAGAPAVAHRAAERAPTLDSRTAPQMPRQVAQPSQVPRVEVRTGESPSVAKQTAPTELEAARTTPAQQATTSPRTTPVMEPQVATTPTAPTESTTKREQPSAPQPQLAQTPVTVPNRQSRSTARPDPVRTGAAVAANATPSEMAPALDASRSSLAQSSGARGAAAPTNAANPAAPSARSAANASASRATAASQPNAAASASPSAQVARARVGAGSPTAPTAVPQSSVASAETPASQSLGGGNTETSRRLSLLNSAGATAGPVSAGSPAATPSASTPGDRAQASTGGQSDSPATATSRVARSSRRAEVATSTSLTDAPRPVTADAGADQPQARPSRLAMTQSLSGVAGVGQSANLDRSPSTPGSPSTTASGAARRAEASQNTPAGPALAPSARAIARRSLVGAESPSASLRATTTQIANAAGTQQPSELNASSSAALAQQSSQAPSGDVSASKGTIDLDLGPTRVADAGGFERASGGGQPNVNLSQDVTSPSRSRPGGSAPFALATNVTDVVSTQTTAGETAQGELASGETAMRQAEALAAAAPTGGSSGAAADAPESATGAAGAATGTRATPIAADAPQVAQSGFGTSAEETEGRNAMARAARRGDLGPEPGSLGVPVPNPSDGTQGGGAAGSGDELVAATADTQMTRLPAGPSGGSGTGPDGPAAPSVSGADLLGSVSAARAEASDAVPGDPLPGGGTGSPQRTSQARELSASRTADVAAIAGRPGSLGAEQGADIAAEGGTPSPTANGALGKPLANSAGALAGDQPRDAPIEGGRDATAGLASRSNVVGDSSQPGESNVSSGLVARSERSPFSTSTQVGGDIGDPVAAMSTATEGAELAEPSAGINGSGGRQQTAASLVIDVAAADGPGGLGDRIAPDVGVNSRLASPESVDVQPTPSRFLRQEVGGVPRLNTAAVFANEAFRGRSPARGVAPGPMAGGAAGPQTEESIELGLAYLARQQLGDGSWTLRSTTEQVQLASDTAATGLCLLAFQGAGYNHREFRYAPQLDAAVQYLVKNQKPDGDLFVPLDDLSNRSVWLYSHGIASLALCEAYGMTQDPALKGPAQKALDFIIASQDPRGGGWRYQPGVESDTSVTGWMMMALKSGELAGLKVPRPTYDHISRWLDRAQASNSERHLYRYNPYAPETPTQRHGRNPTPTMTAVGLLMRLYGGWRRDHPAMVAGADHLRQSLPALGTQREPLRDTYYWYYGTQVMFHMGGSYWNDWNEQLHPLLISTQIKQGDSAGSWSPRQPVPDRWAPHGGRIYVTTMNLLSLEVTYRHLPLYVDTAR